METYIEEAKQFLTDSKTILRVSFNRFDKYFGDDEKRNIFDIELVNKKGSYNFEFGDSLSNSCKETPKIETKGICEIFQGIQLLESGIIIYSHKFSVTYPQLLAVSNGETKAVDLIDQDKLKYDLYEGLNEALEKVESGMKSKLNNQFSFDKVLAMVETRILSEMEKAKKETVLVKQNDKIIEPNAYDILSGLSTNYCEDFADFCEIFGIELETAKEIRQAQSTYKKIVEQDEKLQLLFTEEQLEGLHEIC